MESNETLSTEDPYGNWSYPSYYGEPVLLEENIHDKFHRIFVTICYSLIFCVSLAGNSFLLWALLKQEDLRRTSSLLLLHLTLSDLVFTLPLPAWAAYVNHSLVMSEAACRLLNGMFFLGLYSYMTFLTAMTVHRYRAVVHAITASTFKPNVHLLSGGLWAFCLAFTIPEMVFSEAIEDGDFVDCRQTYGSYLPEYLMYYMQMIIFFSLPFAVIAFCYTRMWFRIQKCRMAQKRQAVQLIFLIVVGFFICWAPYNVFLLIYSLSLQGLIPEVEPEHSATVMFAYTVSHTLAYFHCCLSPIIHILGAGKFRGRLRHQLASFRQFSVRERSQILSVYTGETALSVSGQN
ncbi:hypothetical protein ACEWY4_006231 [Coilia grayii]|uniref:G-protein coupled receptors family 1 profile domain-containing protein n=1 Tax=Coilia grayii TaxID=363190 RepID=A0ABD1KD77_9TELE